MGALGTRRSLPVRFLAELRRAAPRRPPGVQGRARAYQSMVGAKIDPGKAAHLAGLDTENEWRVRSPWLGCSEGLAL